MKEVYFNQSNSCLVVEDRDAGTIVSLVDAGYTFLSKVEQTIELQYPEAFKTLVQLHGNSKEGMFARVRNFLACNFSEKDSRIDIDDDFNFQTEIVPCPARITGICKIGLCNPSITSELTAREIEILRSFAKGFSEDQIAESLFVSKHTIHNHINNMYRKLGLAGRPNPDRKLVSYAYTKKLV